MNRRLVWIAVMALGCTASTRPEPGSQTHFLDTCDGNCPSGLACVCGVCTLPCDEDATCEVQSEAATCSAAMADGQACAGARRVCDVECERDGDCEAVGQGFACEGGRCRRDEARADAGASAGAGGTAGAGASAGTGGRAGAGASGSGGAGGNAGGGGQATAGAGGTADAGPAPDAGGLDCSLPPEVGPCDALIMRWYWDLDQQGCRYFNYGGCMGNANNFATQADCEDACGGKGQGTVSCEVNGVVYPSGSSDIDDPGSCNTCGCEDGQLLCTEIACPEPCPEGTVYGMACAQCGLAGGCSVTRTGCLPTCEGGNDCLQTPGAVCIDGICQLACI